MIIKTFGGALIGINAIPIRIETSIEQGVNFMLIGLPDSAIKESHYRIATALEDSKYKIPVKKIVINMAPADLRKEGAAYDLTIALGILGASEQIKNYEALKDYVIMGELSLDGYLQPIKGALSIAIEAKNQNFKGFILPIQNAQEAAIVKGLNVYGFSHLKEVINFFEKKCVAEPVSINSISLETKDNRNIDFADVKGQMLAKRAFEITAAGGHNIILVGPPGAGKTMLSKRLPSILPPLSLEEALETTQVHSIAGKLGIFSKLITERPFCDPHHTISHIALVGGGSNPMPGEISIAHNGVLFLDELPEFNRNTIEALRQPLEERYVRIARAKTKVEFPTEFMLVASMNPCPCGYYNSDRVKCSCKPSIIQKYMSKISGPLLDRIDLQIHVSAVKYEDISSTKKAESSIEIKKRVTAARNIQKHRFNNYNISCNAQMKTQQINKFCRLNDNCKSLVKTAMENYNLSARAYNRILKVALTIADLANSCTIEEQHVAEAIQYRCLDRGF